MALAWSTLMVRRAGPQPPTHTPMGPGVERLGPGRHCVVPPSMAGWRQPPSSWLRCGHQAWREGVALRHLRTWKGEGAWGNHKREGPESDSSGPKPGPGGSKSKAGQGGELAGGQTAVT